MKKTTVLLAVILTFMNITIPAYAEQLTENVKAAILIEPETNTVLYEENADEKLYIASVTKVMTMLIIMEGIDSGKLSLDDMVTASKNAESYGGSTIYLAENEQFTIHDMLKGIAVASANDGCVAMAEHIAGNEEAFVKMMNDRAKELGMTNTHFVNCNGLDDDYELEDFHSTARDVATMSRELIKHKKIFDYTKIWTDSLRDGKFLLANTNKMIHNYSGATGLKTGSTNKAGCCLSATAERDGMELIAVVLGADTTKHRFSSAKSLLDYGFSNYSTKKIVEKDEKIETAKIMWGKVGTVNVVADEGYAVLQKKTEEKNIEKTTELEKMIFAPIKKGDKLGEMIIKQDGKIVKTINLVSPVDVEKKDYIKIILRLIKNAICG